MLVLLLRLNETIMTIIFGIKISKNNCDLTIKRLQRNDYKGTQGPKIDHSKTGWLMLESILWYLGQMTRIPCQQESS